MYIYEGHLGNLYVSDDIIDEDDLYCETCGDSDHLIGFASNRLEAWNLLESSTDINGSGGWSYDYVIEFIDSNWDE